MTFNTWLMPSAICVMIRMRPLSSTTSFRSVIVVLRRLMRCTDTKILGGCFTRVSLHWISVFTRRRRSWCQPYKVKIVPDKNRVREVKLWFSRLYLSIFFSMFVCFYFLYSSQDHEPRAHHPPSLRVNFFVQTAWPALTTACIVCSSSQHLNIMLSIPMWYAYVPFEQAQTAYLLDFWRRHNMLNVYCELLWVFRLGMGSCV